MSALATRQGDRHRAPHQRPIRTGPVGRVGGPNALLALQGRIDDGLLEDVRLLVSELVTNSVRHSELSPDGLVSLDVSVSATTMRVEVADSGKGFEPRTARSADRSRPGGWGLYLVDRMSDRWGVARESLNRVWFEIDHARPAERHAQAV